MTNLADYYCALPALSSSLPAALYRRPGVIADMQYLSPQFLQLAVKLRSDILFGDSLILSLGPWYSPSYRSLEDQKLRGLADKFYKEICAKLMLAQGEILRAQEDKNFANFCNKLRPTVSNLVNPSDYDSEGYEEIVLS